MNALRKILVVDDDPVIGRSFDRVLSGKGYAVITARNGEEALNKLSHEQYDAVFTDIKMPGMSGLEVAERVKARRPWVPVVIVTGYGTDANESRAEAAGVSGFLRKPLSPEMIERSAERAVLGKAVAATMPEASGPADIAPPEAAPKTIATALKNIALFFAAPFVGLAYILAFPVVGLGMLAWLGAKAAAKHGVAKRLGAIAKHAAMFIAAPFLGLAWIVVMPFVGLGMLVWLGGRALLKRAGPQ